MNDIIKGFGDTMIKRNYQGIQIWYNDEEGGVFVDGRIKDGDALAEVIAQSILSDKSPQYSALMMLAIVRVLKNDKLFEIIEKMKEV